NKKIRFKTPQIIIFLLLKISIRGNNKAISTSKIKKITAIKKKRTEKFKWPIPKGSNPHSNGEFFSYSLICLLPKRGEIDSIIPIINTINTPLTKRKTTPEALLSRNQMYLYTNLITPSSIDRNIKE
ncbi:hypothetical protein DMUE_6265, partial [Dictyocoela muelleri]